MTKEFEYYIQETRKVNINEQLNPSAITDKEHKKLMKSLYTKNNSKRFRK